MKQPGPGRPPPMNSKKLPLLSLPSSLSWHQIAEKHSAVSRVEMSGFAWRCCADGRSPPHAAPQNGGLHQSTAGPTSGSGRSHATIWKSRASVVRSWCSVPVSELNQRHARASRSSVPGSGLDQRHSRVNFICAWERTQPAARSSLYHLCLGANSTSGTLESISSVPGSELSQRHARVNFICAWE